MATIKSFTSLQQSKKLAEILPLESADMCYLSEESLVPKVIYNGMAFFDSKEERLTNIIHCWSLAALLNVLPNKIVSHETAFEGEDAEGINDIYYKRIESTEDGRYMCYYSGNGYKYRYVADNPVDACYEMIIHLHELKML